MTKISRGRALFPYLLSLLIGYFAGSFPTAYLLVRWKSRLDIRTAGTGNVGTMNAFDVTGSKPLGIAVLLVDLAKGLFAVLLAVFLFGSTPLVSGAAGIGAVIGHNYPVWLKFHGGRGLATAAGAFLAMGWVFVPLWCLLWGLVYLRTRDIHTGNVAATLAAPLILFIAPESALSWSVPAGSVESFRWISLVLCVLIMIRHIDVLPAVLKSFHTPTF